MKEIQKITNYEDLAELLITQFKNKPNFVSLVQKILTQDNDLDDAMFEVRDLFWVNTAEGRQLDILGEIQGITRLGRNDEDFKDAIKVQIILNNGSGEPKIIITALKKLYGATKVQLMNLGNANLAIWTDIVLTNEDYLKLLKMVASGINVYLKFGSTIPFVHENDADGQGYTSVFANDLTFSDGTQATFSNSEPVEMIGNESDQTQGGELQSVHQLYI